MKRGLFASALVGVLLLLGFATPAGAGGNSTLPASALSAASGPCGGSYSHIGHYRINSSAGTLAYLDVYWSGRANRNCLVTNHSGRTYGVSLYTQATIRPSGWNWPSCPNSTGCDGGHYSYYAGPVYTPAGVNMTNRCIDVKGVIDWTGRTLTRIHCG
ncbi:hypothetical protein CLV30_102415 [Haloactinopolyspora alba]|uniref:Peptidase inhibitor family I36 n=1 Tax=Haloactinopolyspora alba TaxID=648780 RepID=A0A2P8EC34_9ACTN|nr:hypothetical protein [Haloactinopolyspora alba]PSL07026.1 hypothetical protein CLV30_102415 [Haloactinopolyspora alba]